jgi:enoyl-CoA hydratase/carnithine racemase
MVGDRRAREIVFLCEEIPASQAAEWGLVNRAVPRDALDGAVDAWDESLVRKLPQTTRYAKQQLNVWRDLAWHQTVGHARDWLSLSMLGDEAQGAIREFLDSRRGREDRTAG